MSLASSKDARLPQLDAKLELSSDGLAGVQLPGREADPKSGSLGSALRNPAEDVRFTGPAGELLDKMITAMGLSRDTVYIANVVKYRPPGDRTPTPEETAIQGPTLAAGT